MAGSFAVNNIRSSYVSGGVSKPGAAGDGTTDDTSAIQYWLSQGGLLWAPPGNYKITATCPFTLSGTQFFGSGAAVTSIIADDTAGNFGDMFTMNVLWGCRLGAPGMEFTLDAKSARTAGIAVHCSGGILDSLGLPQSRHAIDVDMNNQFIGVKIDDAGGHGDWGTQIGSGTRRAFWKNFAAGGNAMWFNTIGASQQVHNLLIINPTLTTGPGAGIRYTNSGDIKFFGVDVYGQGGGFLADSNSGNGSGSLLMFQGCEFDSTSTHATYDNFLVNLGGSYSGLLFINMTGVWVAGATGNGVHITGTTAPVQMTWSDGEAYSNGAWGINGASHMTIGSTVLFNANASGATTP